MTNLSPNNRLEADAVKAHRFSLVQRPAPLSRDVRSHKMSVDDVIAISTTVVAALGGGGIIVFALSNWLGKVWAERLMVSERQKHAIELENLRSALTRQNEKDLALIRQQLEVSAQTFLRDHADRTVIYRAAIDLIADVVAKMEMILLGHRGPLSAEEQHAFEVQRLRVYAYLAMHAPHTVMNANDRLMDLILAIVYDGEQTTWEHFRSLAIDLLNEVRKDLAVNPTPISYQGVR